MRRALLLPLVAYPALASACMWDMDTLQEEASLGKDFISTIVGRFPRNPPLYFQMRRDRILAKANKTPEDYDDLAVAYERLGDSLSAIKWIDRKPHGNSTVEYRTHANRGTFLFHAYLHGELGKDSALKALSELETALKINPEAHFGRERVQIRLMKALLNPPDFYDPDKDALKGAEGYAGIIRLGSGWESPDVFRALATDLGDYRESHPRLGAVATLAIDRAEELEKAGKKGKLDFYMISGAQQGFVAEDTRQEFVRLRKEADDWQARRTTFMLERLKTGRHPDTDPTFWEGWVDGPKPEIHGNWFLNRWGYPWYLVLGVGAILLTIVLVPLGICYWLIRLIVRAFRKSK